VAVQYETYNTQYPIAVFLGPSLSQDRAAQILTANYYPPAQMGDVYRLMASGVQCIVLIDGVFHDQAPIWQRELLEAIDNGIQVIGASSMGALRAAELHTYGMNGIGTIFEWYRDHLIDGDDEVAMNHADASFGFRALSEPLVNMRYTLKQAVDEGVIVEEQCQNLIKYAKQMYYADRQYKALLTSPVMQTWPLSVQHQLEQFITHQAVNLKEKDARDALAFCKEAQQRSPSVSASRPICLRNEKFASISFAKRGFLHPSGRLMGPDVLWDQMQKDGNWMQNVRDRTTTDFFLLEWAKKAKVGCPDTHQMAFRKQWLTTYVKGDLAQWLCANGLTAKEFEQEITRHALLDWITKQGPSGFGIDFDLPTQLVDALHVHLQQHTSREWHHANLLKKASDSCLIATWAQEQGLVCQPEDVDVFVSHWAKRCQITNINDFLNAISIHEKAFSSIATTWALADALLSNGPNYYGYMSWSFEAAAIRTYQMTGLAGQTIAKVEIAK